ncbi:MAG: MurT ligase domain-containing protein [Erysipelotrichaceae bacterium]|nr:MurT ligase domain-containing protein [Erysipelotrichaceae bacterium]MDY5251720.1 MurT ligase domain-containing protein [Erysipelotrichaceae bacterium]
MRMFFIVIITKIVYHLSKMRGKQGVTLAGLIALKMDRNILAKLSKQVKEKIIVVCGTNGKTTTNNLIALALESADKKVIYNQTGSNMLNGIIACFILHTNIWGKLDADYACLEIDEASLRRIMPQCQADILVLTNLFRDQLDRYGEIDITMDLLKDGLSYAPKCKLIVNADDVLSMYFAKESHHPYLTFGIKDPVMTQNVNEMREGQFCKYCNHKLTYKFYHYSQLGDYYCPNCHNKRENIDVNGEDILYQDHCEVTINGTRLITNYKGFYNIYNILASCAVLVNENIALNTFNKVLKNFRPENGRLEEFNIQGVKITLNLAKNPAGFNQNINLCLNDPLPKDVLIVINDNAQDGIDVSWLWDVDFEGFKADKVEHFYTSGTRYKDMQLRLKYVDIPSMAIAKYQEAFKYAIEHSTTKNLYILVNYTALYPAHVFLSKLQNEQAR